MPRTTKVPKDPKDRRALMVDKEDHALLREVAEAEGIAMIDATRRAIRMLHADHLRRGPRQDFARFFDRAKEATR